MPRVVAFRSEHAFAVIAIMIGQQADKLKQGLGDDASGLLPDSSWDLSEEIARMPICYIEGVEGTPPRLFFGSGE